jgi:hypothetical protein
VVYLLCETCVVSPSQCGQYQIPSFFVGAAQKVFQGVVYNMCLDAEETLTMIILHWMQGLNGQWTDGKDGYFYKHLHLSE